VTNMMHVVPVMRVEKGIRTGSRQRQYSEDETKEYSKQRHLQNLRGSYNMGDSTGKELKERPTSTCGNCYMRRY